MLLELILITWTRVNTYSLSASFNTYLLSLSINLSFCNRYIWAWAWCSISSTSPQGLFPHAWDEDGLDEQIEDFCWLLVVHILGYYLFWHLLQKYTFNYTFFVVVLDYLCSILSSKDFFFIIIEYIRFVVDLCYIMHLIVWVCDICNYFGLVK